MKASVINRKPACRARSRSEPAWFRRCVGTARCAWSFAVHFVRTFVQFDFAEANTPVLIPVEVGQNLVKLRARRSRSGLYSACGLRQDMFVGMVGPGYRFYGRGRLKKLNR